ncbi:hypothetical protein FACS1894190_03460 [Spirochaetia bacterium]|nr:hypothetical protein FACS1894190_03460 [Spirochaetia bacterium]
MKDKIAQLSIDVDSASASLKKLTDRFESNYAQYMSNEYDESNTRTDFIDRFFELLGWDVRNEQGFSEIYRDVVREDKVVINGQTKAPDYSFRVGGIVKFYVEAKKPSVNIKENTEPAYQVRRYAWTKKLPLSILTDFEEFAIYDTRIKPNSNDAASAARIFYCTFREYEKHFDFIYNTFSKNAILKGSFDKYIDENKNKKGTAEVDSELLNLVEEWRMDLARNIALRNNNISIYNLNTIVQKITSRIIFLRITEDKGIEDADSLLTASKCPNIYEHLNHLFVKANVKYNSGLFKTEKWIEDVIIDDKILQNIIECLYYPKSPYEFSVLPIEILGNIYEKFLGKTIYFRGVKGGHTAIIEEKPEVKKAGGVFYTPQYIVDFIVQNTIGIMIKDKTPDEIAALRFVDPACGSGSFLVGVYQYLLNYHLDYYSSEKNLKSSLKKEKIYEATHGAYKLTISEKQKILQNNIYGVDIDNQAVEVTKLSLYLKLLENEGNEAKEQLYKFTDITLLPSLENNIKCGNSLIGTDFYAQGELSLSEEEQFKVNCFDWEKEFAAIFKNDGFDAVIGNPPYGAELLDSEREYLDSKFKIGNTDTAALFLLKARNLLNENGKTGFIIPKAFTYASNWQKTRNIILPDIEVVADCGKVWQEVKLEMSICINQKNNKKSTFVYYKREDKKLTKFGSKKRALCKEFDLILNGVDDKETEIGLKIKRANKTLNDFIENKRGAMLQKNVSKKGNIFVLAGKQVGRYFLETKIVKGKIDSKLVLDEKALLANNSVLVQNIVAHIEKPYPHILISASLNNLENRKSFVILDTVNQLTIKNDFSPTFILGIINSHLVSWYAYRFIFANAIRTMHFDSVTTMKIPFPEIYLSKPADKTEHDKLVTLVDKMLDLKRREHDEPNPQAKTVLQRQIDAVDSQIDTVVYKLYNLTDDEVKVVEGEQ